jgi:hypothetical protein
MNKEQINEYAAAYVATMVDGRATDDSNDYVEVNKVADEATQAKIMEAIDLLVHPSNTSEDEVQAEEVTAEPVSPEVVS